MPPNTVKVDRSTKWGNPFVVGVDGTRQECVDLFRNMMRGWVCISCAPGTADAQLAYRKMLRTNLRYIRGKNLGCWCPLNAPCHADVLLEAAAQ